MRIFFQEDTTVTVAEGVLGIWKTMTVVDRVKKDFMDDTVKKVSILVLPSKRFVLIVKMLLAFSLVHLKSDKHLCLY